jgi:hypothetical protein
MNSPREMRIMLEGLEPCLKAGNTAPLENLLLSMIEWIEEREKMEIMAGVK